MKPSYIDVNLPQKSSPQKTVTSPRGAPYIRMLISHIRKFDKPPPVDESGSMKRKGLVFLEPWDGLTITKVEVRGVVTGVQPIGEGGSQLSLDDGTGRISVVVWKGESAASPVPEALFNRFVSAKGPLMGFRTEVQVRSDFLALIADEEECTEESLWWLAVKEEWECLAAAARMKLTRYSKTEVCPCLCHSAGGACACLGSIQTWPPSFVRAVSVVEAVVRTVARTHSKLTLSTEELVGEIKACKDSECLSRLPCYSDCVTVQAIRELIKSGFIEKSSCGKLKILSSPNQPTSLLPLDEPKYPLTPFELPPSQTAAVRTGGRRPNFFPATFIP